MKKRTDLPVLVECFGPDQGYICIGEVALRCGIHPGLVHRLVRLGLVEPVSMSGTPRQWHFQREVVPQVAKIIRLRNELGLNYSSIGVVLDLLQRIEILENRIRKLKSSRAVSFYNGFQQENNFK